MIYPSISIIIPTIGRNTLERTLRSILDSKYPNLEIIVSANNVKKDKIIKILDIFNANIILLHTNNKLTPAQAKNIGNKVASKKYLTWLDDDDFCYYEKFLFLSRYLETHPETFGVFGQYNVRDCYSNKIKNTNCGGCGRVGFDTLIQNNYIASGAIMLRNDPVVRFDESLPYGWGEDYKLWLDLLGQGHKIDFIPVPVYAWTQNLKEGFTATFNKKGIDWRQLTKNIQNEMRGKWIK